MSDKAERLIMCRVCLRKDIEMTSILNTHLHEFYDKLVGKEFASDDHKPVLVCDMCLDRMESCYQLKKMSIRSNTQFQI